MIVAAFVSRIHKRLKAVASKLTQESGEETVPEITMQDLLLFKLTRYEDTKCTAMRLPGDKAGIFRFSENVVELLCKSHVFDFCWRFVVVTDRDHRVIFVRTAIQRQG